MGGFIDGKYFGDFEDLEAKICEEGDYILSDKEEALLGLVGKAYCKPDFFKYKISGQFSSTFYKSSAIKITPCPFFNEAEAICESDTEKIKEALRKVNLNLIYKQSFFDNKEFRETPIKHFNTMIY